MNEEQHQPSEEPEEEPSSAENLSEQSSESRTSGYLVSSHTSVEWDYPWPPPGALEKFEEILPGAAERIFNEFEKEAAHRRTQEENALKSSIRRSWGGLILGTVVILAVLFLAGFLAYIGQSTAATIIAAADLAAILWAYLSTANSRNSAEEEHEG